MTMKVSAWGMSLNTEIQHSKPQVTCLIQVICCQRLCNGEPRKAVGTSWQWCDGCYANRHSKQMKAAGTSARVQEVAEAQPGCSWWHPTGDSPVTRLRRAGIKATPLGTRGPGTHRQADIPGTFWGGDSRVLPCPC